MKFKLNRIKTKFPPRVCPLYQLLLAFFAGCRSGHVTACIHPSLAPASCPCIFHESRNRISQGLRATVLGPGHHSDHCLNPRGWSAGLGNSGSHLPGPGTVRFFLVPEKGCDQGWLEVGQLAQQKETGHPELPCNEKHQAEQ